MNQPPATDSHIPRWAGPAAVVLMTAALLPCFSPVVPVAYFDTDPRGGLSGVAAGEAEPLIALGPVGLAVWQWLTTLLAAGLLGLGWWRARRSLARWSTRLVAALAAAGGAAVLWHMVKPSARWEDWQQAGQWTTAATAGLAAWRLGRYPAARRWAVALGVAATLPLLLEAAYYVGFEHPMSVAFFEQHRQQLLQARGLEPGSMPAVLYERRLRFADATGAFGLSNVLASVAGTFATLALTAALWSTRRRYPAGSGAVGGSAESHSASNRTYACVLAGCGAGGLVTVYLTGSKGAAVAAAAVLPLVAVAWAVDRWQGWPIGPAEERPADTRVHGRVWAWLVPSTAVLLLAGAVLATLARGAMGPPTAPETLQPGVEVQGERSLLFRAQYWSAAARMWADHPVLGVGPGGFSEAYLRLKDPLNPESVTSSHNVLVDAAAMLGLGGLAWGGLLIGGLWWAGRGAAQPPLDRVGKASASDPRSGSPMDGAGSAVRLAGLSGLLIFGVALWVLRPGLYVDTAALWLVGAAGYVAAAAWLGGGARGGGTMVPGSGIDAAARWGLLGAATFALLHNQIEMAFIQPGSVTILAVLIGLAAGAGTPRNNAANPASPQQTTAGGSTPKVRRVAQTAAGVMLLVLPVAMSTAVLVGSVRHDSSMAAAAGALRRGLHAEAVTQLEKAQDAAGFDQRALTWRVRLEAAEPMAWMIENGRREEAAARVGRAQKWIDHAEADYGPTAASTRLRVSLLRQWGELADDRAALVQALSGSARLAELTPYNVADAMDRAELADEVARRGGDITPEQLNEMYERVWTLRQRTYLDASDPLTPDQLIRLREALGREGAR